MYKNLSKKINKIWLIFIIGAVLLFAYTSFTQKPKETKNENNDNQIAYTNCAVTSEEEKLTQDEGPLKTNKSIGIIDFEKDTIKGVEKNSITAISETKFISYELASKCINPGEEVFELAIGESTKIYPKKILNWHEVVNDEVADENGNAISIVITYSPLTNTVNAFNRELQTQEYFFGLSGRVWQSIPLLYDDKTESLWSQLTGEALIGDLTGQKLGPIKMKRTIFEEDVSDAEVLSFDTGYVRDYDNDPYAAYKNSEGLFYKLTEVDERLELKDTVIGIEVDGITKAYPIDLIEEEFEDEIGGVTIKIIKNYLDYSVSRSTQDGKFEKIAHTICYWFAWYSTYPKTLVFEE